MQEADVMRTIMIALSKIRAVRIFRNNTGQAWAGNMSPGSTPARMILLNARPLNAGLCKGSSDIIGWTEVKVTPEMVGKTVALFTAIETKSKAGRVTQEQQNFINTVQQAGGIAGVARNEQDALKIVGV